MIDTDFLKQLDRFNLVLKKRVHSAYSGSREARNPGSGLVFRDYREYTQGDDFRKIDWRVYGRTNKYFIRRFEEERNLTLHIIVDASASMDFGKPKKKFEYASMLGLGFAYIALKNNEKFEFTTFSDRLVPVKAKKGVNQIIAIIDSLNEANLSGKSNLKDSLFSYKKLIKTKSMVVIISDFLFDLDELKEALSRFKKHEVFLIQVLDPMEWKFNLTGDYKLVDSESKFSIKTLISNRLRNKYKLALEEHINEIKRFSDQISAKYTCVTTDIDVFDSFYNVIG